MTTFLASVVRKILIKDSKVKRKLFMWYFLSGFGRERLHHILLNRAYRNQNLFSVQKLLSLEWNMHVSRCSVFLTSAIMLHPAL